ncbi:hypothetical protein ACFX2J_034870 [Malus domestica]
MDCAETIQQNNFNLAKALVTQIDYLASSQADAMCKVTTFFAETMAHRIFRVYPQSPIDHSFSGMLYIHFYETRPDAIENVLLVVKQMKPKIVTVVEQKVNHNGSSRRSEG